MGALRIGVAMVSMVLLAGCLTSSGTVVSPPGEKALQTGGLTMGRFEIVYDQAGDTLRIEPVPCSDRSAQIDVTKWAQLGIDSLEWDPIGRNWTINAWLRNPTLLTAYGVWVVFTELGEKELVGQDGFVWYEGPGGVVRAPFVAVAKGQPLRMFPPQHEEDVIIVIHWPEEVDKWIPVQFVIDASWPTERQTPMVESLVGGFIDKPDPAYFIKGWVADFQDSASTLDVHADLSPIGGDAQAPLFDDGMHQDGGEGDSVFGVVFNTDAPPGDYAITVYAIDPFENPMENDVELTVIDTTEPFIEIVAPNGGEVWEVGSDREITWTSSGVPGNVSVLYSKDNFVSNFNLIGIDVPNDGGFMWEDIPDDPSATVRVRVISVDIDTLYDDSDEYFTIFKPPWIEVISPNGGENWEIGSDRPIHWESGDVPGDVDIFYSKDNFVSDINPIALNEPNDGSMMWENIPNDPSETVRVGIRSTDEPSIYDYSDSVFTISQEGDPCWDFFEIREGQKCNIDAPMEFAIRSQAEWDEFLLYFGNWPFPPKIDWETEMVLGMFLGEMSHGGYWLEVNDICKDDADILHVNYTKWWPGDGCSFPWVFTQPFLVVKTDLYDGEIVFDSEWKEDHCDW